MPDELTIRHCDVGDAPIITDLGRKTFLDAYQDVMDVAELTAYVDDAFTTGKIASELADPACTFLLAEVMTGWLVMQS